MVYHLEVLTINLFFFSSLGPVDLTVGELIPSSKHCSGDCLTFYVGTLSPDTSSSIPTVTDNLFSSGSIAEHLVSISFEPITDSTGQQLNGELSWGVCISLFKALNPKSEIFIGGTDSDKYIGEITYT